VDTLAGDGTASQVGDITETHPSVGSDPVAPSGPLVTKKGAPGVRDAQSVSLLTVAEVARRLGVCRATVYRICAEGRLGHVRVSNAIRVPDTALALYVLPHGSP
jgi:excisionase family DNA binding protein